MPARFSPGVPNNAGWYGGAVPSLHGLLGPPPVVLDLEAVYRFASGGRLALGGSRPLMQSASVGPVVRPAASVRYARSW